MAGFTPAFNDDHVTPQPADDVVRWRRWLIMFILLTGGIKTTLVFTTVVPALQLISEYFKGMGDDVLNAQMVVTFGPAGMAVAGLTAGWIVGKGNLRRTLIVTLGLTALTGLSQLWIPSLPVLLANRFLLGFTAVTCDVAMMSILAAQFSGRLRSQIIGFRQGISSVGTVSTMLLAGYVAQHYGWRAPSWLFLIPLFLMFAAIVAFDRPIVVVQAAATSEQLKLRQMWSVFALSLIMSVAHTMPSFQMPFLLRENGVTSAILISRIPALSAFISIISAMSFGWVYSRFGKYTLVIAAVCMGTGFIGVSLAPSFNFILGCVVIEGVGAGLTMPYFQNRLLDRITPGQRSSAIGFLTTSLFLGHFVNPLITAPIRNNFGIHATFLVVGVALVLGSIALSANAFRSRTRSDSRVASVPAE